MDSLVNIVQSHALIISTAILIISYIFIALEKIPKMTIALVGASITLILGLLGHNAKVEDSLNPYYFINYIIFRSCRKGREKVMIKI